MRRYVYFVSSAHRTGFGWIEAHLPAEITGSDHLKGVIDYVQRNSNAQGVCPLSFQLLRVEDAS